MCLTSALVNGGSYLTKVHYLETDSRDSKVKSIESPLSRALVVISKPKDDRSTFGQTPKQPDFILPN